MAIENQYIQTSLMVVLSLFRGKEVGGPMIINPRWTLSIYLSKFLSLSLFFSPSQNHPAPTVPTTSLEIRAVSAVMLPFACQNHSKVVKWIITTLCIFADPLQIPRLPSFVQLLQSPHVSHFWQEAQSIAPSTPNRIQISQSLRDQKFLTLLTSNCALRRNGAHSFDIAISNSGPNIWCF